MFFHANFKLAQLKFYPGFYMLEGRSKNQCIIYTLKN